MKSKGIRMWRLNLKFIGFLVVLSIILSSCLSLKPGSVKSGKKLYETFFVGEDGTQYFIKPLMFGTESNSELNLDIAFRYKNVIKDSAIFNMSFLQTETIKEVDSVSIHSDSVSITIKGIKYLFSERSKRIYLSRFSANVDLKEVKKIFNGNNWTIVLYRKGISTSFSTPEITKKKLGKLNYDVFMLF